MKIEATVENGDLKNWDSLYIRSLFLGIWANKKEE